MRIDPLKRRQPLYTDIAKYLHDEIVSGALKPGDTLPGQRELAEQFEASLASVREAISVLSAIGLLEVRPGRGTTVVGMSELQSQFDGWLGMADSLDAVEELLAARRVLETFTVVKAVENATDAGIEELQAAAARMKASVSDLKLYLDADVAFHTKLSELSGNRVVARLMRVIRLPLRWQLKNSNRRHLEEHGSLALNLDTHLRLVDALRQRNVEAALGCVNEMVDRATRLIFDQAEPEEDKGSTVPIREARRASTDRETDKPRRVDQRRHH